MPDKIFLGMMAPEARFSRLKRPVWHSPMPTPPLNHNFSSGRKFSTKKDMKGFFSNKDFWKDALLFLGALCLFYLIWVVVEYWPEIVQGFNRGWSGE